MSLVERWIAVILLPAYQKMKHLDFIEIGPLGMN